MKFKTTLAVSAAASALALGLTGTQAWAQSTGSSEVEKNEVVITASRVPVNLAGLAGAQTVPKARSSLDKQFIGAMVPGQTILDTINLLPGVNFTNNDAFGSAGGDLTLRGFDSQRLALLQDGLPLNDSGNYAVYPNQQLDSELIERVTINLGTTDVDSPTPAAAGGTIDYITKKPTNDMGLTVELEGGTEHFRRFFGVFDSGRFGPWGTKLWISAARARNDIFNAPGKIDKTQYNARIWQDIGDRGDFVSVAVNYNRNRNNFIRRITLAQFNAGLSVPYDAACSRPTPVNGTVQNEATSGTGFTALCANYNGNNINPSNTGNIRGQSSFHLMDNLVLTVDPAFQYVLANGGGRTIFPENDRQLRGNTSSPGIDLNGDGDILDRVLVYWPNTTNTYRWTVSSSLIWSFMPGHNVRVSYTFDRARHRQTGEATLFDQNGDPLSVFGGKDGYGPPIALPDGTNLRRRDRYSIAMLNQVSFEYRGRWLDDKLLVNAGVRLPWFHRELNQNCYMSNTFNAFCTTQVGTPVAGSNDNAGVPLVTFPTSSQVAANTQWGQPRKFQKNYHKALPSVGATYEFTPHHSVYASFAETLSAPRTDDLYDQKLTNPNPETTETFDIGYRYTSPVFIVAVDAFHTNFHSRIERAFDEAANIFYSINIGDMKLKGVTGELGFKPSRVWSGYASISYVDTEILADIPNGVVNGVPVFLATKGKELYETPKVQGAFRINFDPVESLHFGFQGKIVGTRWSNLTNTEQAPAYKIFDLDVRYRLDDIGLKGMYIQANVKNLFGQKYLGDISTNPSGTAQFQPGYPREATFTLHATF